MVSFITMPSRHSGGMDGVDPNPVLRQLIRPHLHQPDQPVAWRRRKPVRLPGRSRCLIIRHWNSSARCDPPRPPLMRAGIAASTVFQTPMRFTSTMSREDLAAVYATPPSLMMPALAMTMRVRPNRDADLDGTVSTRRRHGRRHWWAMIRPTVVVEERFDGYRRGRSRAWRRGSPPSRCRAPDAHHHNIGASSGERERPIGAALTPCRTGG